MRRVLAAAFVRWNVEHVFRVAKSEVGLTHFEGRSYVSLMRHLALCLVVLAFVALHTMRLRGEKSGGHGGASLPGAGPGCAADTCADGGGPAETECLLDILVYHQERNAAARKSRQKRPRKLRRFTAL